MGCGISFWTKHLTSCRRLSVNGNSMEVLFVSTQIHLDYDDEELQSFSFKRIVKSKLLISQALV